MIVFDASVAVELVLRTARAETVAARVFSRFNTLHAPHLIDIEVVQVLRRLTLAKEITADKAVQGLEYFRALAIQRHVHDKLMSRIWSLRSSLSAYDAAYIALAEALPAPLLTCDEKLSRAHGHTAKIELVTLN